MAGWVPGSRSGGPDWGTVVKLDQKTWDFEIGGLRSPSLVLGVGNCLERNCYRTLENILEAYYMNKIRLSICAADVGRALVLYLHPPHKLIIEF